MLVVLIVSSPLLEQPTKCVVIIFFNEFKFNEKLQIQKQ